MTRRSTSEGLVSAIRVTAGLWCVNHEQGVRSERVHDRVDVPAGCGSTPGSSDCARVGPLSSRLTAKREDVGARAFGTSGNARMHGCEQRELRRQSPTALCSDGASGAAHRGPCRSMVTRIPPVPLSPIQSGELSDGRPGRFPGHQRQCNAVSAIVAGADVARRLGQGTQPTRASQRQHPARATSSKPVDCLALWESAMAVRVGTFRAIHSQSRVPVGFEGSGIER